MYEIKITVPYLEEQKIYDGYIKNKTWSYENLRKKLKE